MEGALQHATTVAVTAKGVSGSAAAGYGANMSPATAIERASSPADFDSELDVDVESAPLISDGDAADANGPFGRTPWNSGINWDQFRSQHWEQEGPRLYWKRVALVVLIPFLFYLAYSLSKRPFRDPGWRPDGDQP